MNLKARIERIEAGAPAPQVVEVMAADAADFADKWLEVFLSHYGRGSVRIVGAIAGVPIDQAHDFLPHEDMLELLQ